MSGRREKEQDTCRVALAVAELRGGLYEELAAFVDVVDEVDVGAGAVLGGEYADGVGAEEACSGEGARDGGGGVEDVAECGVGLEDEVGCDEPVEEGARSVVGAVHADGGDADRGIDQLDHCK